MSLGGAADDRAGEPAAVEEELAVPRAVRPHAPCRPRPSASSQWPKRRHVEVADLDDVHQQAAAVRRRRARPCWRPTTRPCSCAVGSMAWTSGCPVTRFAPRAPRRRRRRRSARSSAGGRPRRCRRRFDAAMPEPSSHSRLVRMPVAMITTSAASRLALLERRACACRRDSSIAVSVAPVRSVDAVLLEPPLRRCAAHAASTMRGRMRGATSTMVSVAPRARIAFRIVKAMKPAPDHDHVAARPDRRRSPPRASSSVQKQCTPGPSAPGIGGSDGARAGGDQAVVVLDRGAVVERAASGLRCRGPSARRPSVRLDLPGRRATPGVAV